MGRVHPSLEDVGTNGIWFTQFSGLAVLLSTGIVILYEQV